MDYKNEGLLGFYNFMFVIVNGLNSIALKQQTDYGSF